MSGPQSRGGNTRPQRVSTWSRYTKCWSACTCSPSHTAATALSDLHQTSLATHLSQTSFIYESMTQNNQHPKYTSAFLTIHAFLLNKHLTAFESFLDFLSFSAFIPVKVKMSPTQTETRAQADSLFTNNYLFQKNYSNIVRKSYHIILFSIPANIISSERFSTKLI